MMSDICKLQEEYLDYEYWCGLIIQMVLTFMIQTVLTRGYPRKALAMHRVVTLPAIA